MRHIALAIILTACGTDATLIKLKPHENKELKPYVEMFYEDAGVYGKHISRGEISYYLKDEPLAEELPTAVGVCFKSKNKLYLPYIVVSNHYWAMASFLERKALIYHEMAHCLMNLGHVNEHPSLMYPNVYGDAYLQIFWDGMVEDLFVNRGEPR